MTFINLYVIIINVSDKFTTGLNVHLGIEKSKNPKKSTKTYSATDYGLSEESRRKVKSAIVSKIEKVLNMGITTEKIKRAGIRENALCFSILMSQLARLSVSIKEEKVEEGTRDAISDRIINIYRQAGVLTDITGATREDGDLLEDEVPVPIPCPSSRAD